MSQEPIIQVGILTAIEIEFVLNGAFTASNGKTYTGIQRARCSENRVFFDEMLLSEITFEPSAEAASFDLNAVVIGINFHWERKENQRFKGALRLIVENTNVTAINRVAVEDYLTSVISSEMSATASEELLKAHAVISRSWLLHPLQATRVNNLEQKHQTAYRTVNAQLSTIHYTKWYERDAHSNFDVCADDHCQRYQGITRATTLAVEQAIKATRGEVLMFENEICDARFSKSCGGISESFENCWAPHHYSYLTPVIDNAEAPKGYKLDFLDELNANDWIRHSPPAFCNTSDKKILSQVLNLYDQETADFYRWSVEYSQAEIAELLKRRSGIDFGDILDLIPIKRGNSGRIIELQICGSKQTAYVGKELEIRKWLSNTHLYSSAFVVDKLDFVNDMPQLFRLTGAGWGHGVGLCQIGAAMMGEKGYNYKAILMHYFRGANLERIYGQ